MNAKKCLLCGRLRSDGLRLMDCLICADCEHRLVRDAMRPAEAARARKRLIRLYPRRAARAAPG